MKKLLTTTVIAGLVGVCALMFSCGTSPKELNQELVQVQQHMKDGTITRFEDAKGQLDSLKSLCETRISEIEFDTDEEKIKEKENLQTVIARINETTENLVKEKDYYEGIFSGEKTTYQSLQAASTYFSMFPEGFFHRKAKLEFNQVFGQFVDGVSNNLVTLTKGLSEENTESSLFQLISYTEEQTEQPERSSFTEEQIDQATERLHTVRDNMQGILSSFPADFVSKNGNSLQGMKQQFEEFENKAGEIRKAREAFIREVIEKEIKSGYWETRAHGEIEAHILRERGGYFSSCDAAYLNNRITKAEEDQIVVTSTKATVKLHYNVNSYCANNAKSKYYDASFTLVIPVIKREFGSGYFENRNIRQTE